MQRTWLASLGGGGGALKETNALNKSPPEGPDTENQIWEKQKKKEKKRKENVQNAADVGCVCVILFLIFFFFSFSFGEVYINYVYSLSNCYLLLDDIYFT